MTDIRRIRVPALRYRAGEKMWTIVVLGLDGEWLTYHESDDETSRWADADDVVRFADGWAHDLEQYGHDMDPVKVAVERQTIAAYRALADLIRELEREIGR